MLCFFFCPSFVWYFFFFSSGGLQLHYRPLLGRPGTTNHEICGKDMKATQANGIIIIIIILLLLLL